MIDTASTTPSPVTASSKTLGLNVASSPNDPAGFADLEAQAARHASDGDGDLIGTISKGVDAYSKWAKHNPDIVKMAGGLIGGAATNAANQAQAAQKYRLAWANNQAAYDRYNASLAGLRAPTYVGPGAKATLTS